MGDNSGLLSCWNVTAHLKSGDTHNPQPNFWDRTIQAPREWEFKSLTHYGRGKNGDIKSTPMVYRDLVYFTSWDRTIYALNKFTGNMVVLLDFFTYSSLCLCEQTKTGMAL
ncbi:hypothetical protein QOT17_022654 [Balamuthia mandrillaris]